MIEKVKCPHCGETEQIVEISKQKTFDEPVSMYKCLKCNQTF